MPGETILLIGASGQIGAELTMLLRSQYGNSNVIAADIKQAEGELFESGPFEVLNVLDKAGIAAVADKYRITQIYNMAAMLSATGEKFPQKAWQLNMDGLINTLEIAREKGIPKMYWPSLFAAFGPTTPKVDTPQTTIMEPNTIYGISKQAGERWCEWYYLKYGLDVRSIRYPGIISYKTEPGGGTTDYAVEIYYEAIKNKSYVCYLKPGTFLDMMYMPDALRALVDLMEADPSRLKHRNCFNVTAMSFDPEMIAAEIKKHIPEFHMEYQIDSVKQAIADSWPNKMDDSAAREEWGWKPEYDLASMTEDMLRVLSTKLS